ncbi:MAG: leucine--tRNA ligase, partial [Candidatus Enteromonas sp.]|nr:leucine--tRNA ligase [Candidatus Enteromonas sp.]
KLGHEGFIDYEPWPTYDPKALIKDEVKIAVSVNGKTRDVILIPAEASQEEALRIALQSEKVRSFVLDKPFKKVIYVKGRILNLVC